MTLRAIETSLQRNKIQAKEVLERAVGEEFESVIIFGFKDGRVHRMYSGCINYLEKLVRWRKRNWSTWGKQSPVIRMGNCGLLQSYG